MSRLCMRLTIVVAAFSWLSNDLSFGAGMTCKRIDSLDQILKWVDGVAEAWSSSDPSDSQGEQKKTTSGETTATYGINVSASSGGSESGNVSTLTASNAASWGATGIGVPQVSLAMGTALSAVVDPSDPDALATAELDFGNPDNCVATGEFEANSGDATGTFSGTMDIIITITPSGIASLETGSWSIVCGDSYLSANLTVDGDGWDVSGGMYVDGVWQDMTGTWPLEVNTVLNPTEPVSLGYTFTLEIELYNFLYGVTANDETPDSGLTAGLSFTSSASILP